MIRHLFRMVWKRRRSNALIVSEITLSFLVLTIISVIGVYYVSNYTEPLGFEYENVWVVTTDMIKRTDLWTRNDTNILIQLYNALKDFPEVQAIGTGWPIPFWEAERTNVYHYESGSLYGYSADAGLDYKDVFNIEMERGRWFEASDEVAEIKPVVINRAFADRLFGDDDPLGQTFYSSLFSESKTYYRVIGLLGHFKIKGELSGDNPLVLNMEEPITEPEPFENFILRVSPGATAELEERIISRFRAIGGDLTIKIERLGDSRKAYFARVLLPVLAAGLVSLSLLIMVSLGLIGVLWQNVAKRMREIGLRRAKGATKINIYNQITGELLCVTTFGLLLGIIIVMQFPILHIIDFIDTKIYLAAIAIAALIIYMISYVSGMYPSYLAAKVHPAEALRGE